MKVLIRKTLTAVSIGVQKGEEHCSYLQLRISQLCDGGNRDSMVDKGLTELVWFQK